MFITKFIGGNSIFQVKNIKLPYGKIYDYVKESDSRDHIINHQLNILALKETHNSIHAIKLSGLHNINLEKYLDEYNSIAINNNHKILIDAENVKNQDMINEYSNYCIKNYTNTFYKTYQMYRNDSYKLLENDLLNYKNGNKNSNNHFGIKLVRGAYYNEDKNTGLLYLKKEDTDRDYNKAIDLLSNYNNDVIIATHNTISCEIALNYKKKFKYAQLLGMNDKLSNYLLKNSNEVYKYIPYGKWVDTIPYLTRRLYENYDILRYIL
jgi:hypothetical protein